MTAAILQIAQWSAENQPYSLALHDQIGEAITIQVSLMAAKTIYFVRVGGQILPFGEDELIGDPDYDQEKGGYTDAAV